jgi:hypothetical protein
MVLEARGQHDAAIALYEEVLQAQPTHAGLWKRKVAAMRGAGRDAAAAAELAQYLEAFPADAEAVRGMHAGGGVVEGWNAGALRVCLCGGGTVVSGGRRVCLATRHVSPPSPRPCPTVTHRSGWS